VFVFNDVLVVTKTISGKKRTQHQFRDLVDLSQAQINVFSTREIQWGVEIRQSGDQQQWTFEARSLSDQQRLVTDLQESAKEAFETEKARVELNRERQQLKQQQHQQQLQHQQQQHQHLRPYVTVPALPVAAESFC